MSSAVPQLQVNKCHVVLCTTLPTYIAKLQFTSCKEGTRFDVVSGSPQDVPSVQQTYRACNRLSPNPEEFSVHSFTWYLKSLCITEYKTFITWHIAHRK